MSLQIFTNNAVATLASSIGASDTVAPLAAGNGARFPALTGGSYFLATLKNMPAVGFPESDPYEVVKVTAISGDTITAMVRGVEGTAQAWNAGDKFEIRPTAKFLNDLVAQAYTPPQVSTTPAFENLVAGQTFTAPLEDMGSNITVAGTAFTRTYPGSVSASSLAYSLAAPTIVNASNVNVSGLTNASTGEVKVGSIKLPGNSLINSKTTQVTVTVTASGNLPACTLSLGFSATRTGSQYRVTKVYSDATSSTFTLELLITPIASSMIKFSSLRVSTAPTTLPATSGYLDLNLLGAVEFPIFFKFAAAVSPATCTITSITAQASLAAATPSAAATAAASTSVARSLFQKPFAPDDFFNQKISSTAICRRTIATCNPATTGDTTSGTINASGSAGKYILTVFSTAGIRPGMMPSLGVYRATSSDYGMGDDAAGTNQQTTQNFFGYGNYVDSVISSTQLLMKKPFVADLMLRGTFYYGMPCVTFAWPETLCMGIGAGTNGYGTRHLVNGAVHADYYAAAYTSILPIVQASISDPVKSWTAGYIVGYNGWPHAQPAQYSSNNGETFTSIPYQMRTPVTGVLASSTTISAGNGDHNTVVVSADGSTEMDGFLTYVDANGNYTPNRASAWSLAGYSVPNMLGRPEVIDSGHSQGNRAYGGSVMAGTIRAWELALLPPKPTAAMTPAQAAAYLAQVKATPITHRISAVLASHILRSKIYSFDGTTNQNFVSYRSQFDIHQPAIKAGGTGYAVGDVLYITGGAGTCFMRVTVTAVSATGAVTGVFVSNVGMYYAGSAPPDAGNLVSTTSGIGSGCVLNALATADPAITTTAQAFPTTSLPSVYAYPATSADNDWGSTYAGCIPMGSLLAIPREVDLDSWFTYLLVNRPSNNVAMASATFFAICYAAQDYGVVAVDRAGNTNNTMIFDSDCTAAQISDANGGGYGIGFFNTHLAIVENVTPAGAGPKAASFAPVSNKALATGTGSSGTTITASFPTGTVGTIQFTRTLLASPFTKSNISGALANGVNSLSYTLQPADQGYRVGYDESNQVTSYFGVEVPATVPDVPTSLVVTPGNASASIAANAPANNGGSPITGYLITDSVTGTQYPTATLPYNLTGLNDGATRTVSVQAVNAVGAGQAAVSSSFSPTVPVARVEWTHPLIDMTDNGLIANPGLALPYPGIQVKRDLNRLSITIQNNTPGSVGFGVKTEDNSDYNPVTYTQLATNTEQYISGSTAVNQVSLQVVSQTLTALTSSGTTATATLANHGFNTGDIKGIGNCAPSGYNGFKTITVVDANTFTYTLASSQAAVTTLPVVIDPTKTVTIITESST